MERRTPSLTDPERLAVLRDLAILDTPAEPDYDDLALLASTCCRSPIAAVNFVDADRHWTKAIVGAEGARGASVSANLSLCAATLTSGAGLLSLADTSQDEAWRSHPFVTGPPHLRHYAGATIVISGQAVGVVCVFGQQPRDLGDAEEQALVALARQASAHLELRQRNAQLRDFAGRDPLTGLANRTLLYERLEAAIAQSTDPGGRVGVLFCDINDFKQVNDRFGHEAGDRLLCRVADRLRAGARETDTVCRFAGDEFVVVCPGLDGPDEFGSIIGRINRALHQEDPADLPPSTPRVSFGAVLLEGDERASDVLRRADEAMYKMKALKS